VGEVLAAGQIALAGCACGALASLLAGRLVRAMLYEVSPADPLTLGLVAGSLLCAAALAIAVPARSSTRVDATMALRP
jgi:putative ABC transport system permease protein